MKKSQNKSVCLSSQRNRVLEWLRKQPLTTFQARNELDVMHPSARVMELKAQGYDIQMHRETVDNGQGKHKIAKYVLFVGGDSHG